MRQVINLYLGDMEVEFNQPPEILYTYTQDELSNPTILKNGFSKTVTIEGTKQNNKIFGHFWNLERIQDYGTYSGVYFNPTKKTPFTLYVNGDIYESGYAKLTEVRKLHNGVEYDIDLYGGLGQFFNGLNENKSTGSKLRLCDLDYMGTDDSESEFNFTVDKNTIKRAWFDESPYAAEGYFSHYINFVPAYNGVPQKDFDSNKVLINAKDAPDVFVTRADAEGNPITNPRVQATYLPYGGSYIYSELPNKLTEWEMGDLRSGYQRPAIRMMEVIKACKKYMERPENGGWTVELDPDFFNVENPYWNDTWMTLPMLSEVNYINDEIISDYQPTINVALSSRDATSGKSFYSITGLENSSASTISFSVHYGINNYSDINNYDKLYVSQYASAPKITYSGAILLRLECLNELGSVVAASDWQYLTNETKDNEYNWNLTPGTYEFHSGLSTGVQHCAGYFKKINNKLYWVSEEKESEPMDIVMSLDLQGKSWSTMRLTCKWLCNYRVSSEYRNSGILFRTNYYSGLGNTVVTRNAVSYENPEVAYLNSTTNSGGRVLSGKEFTKKDILNTTFSPAEYLISYCKLFNLHFIKSSYENKISILTRRNFYQRDSIIDLEKYIDRSKDYKIHPVAFDKQWYDFKLPMVEGQFAQDYKATTSYDYGVKRVNTGYEFDGSTKDLLEGSALKNAIECVEKSKYYSYVGTGLDSDTDDKEQPWMLDGLKYSLFNKTDSTDTVEFELEPKSFIVQGISDFQKYYDLFPKLQLHQGENKGIDGSGVLVFFNGYQDLISANAVKLNYWITDDIPAMIGVGGNSCWLYTVSSTNSSGDEIGIKLTQLPRFERYRMNGYNIAQSLDFGEPRQLYCPHYLTRENSTLYYQYWDKYIADMYDVNTRVLDCYVRLDDKPNPDWLRRFYWFDNSIWRINKIEDWSVSSFETTKIQFIKVQDVQNYTSEISSIVASISISADTTIIPDSGGTVTFTVNVSDGGCWVGSDAWEAYTGSIPRGCGDSTTFSVTFPATTEGRVMRLNVCGDQDQWADGVEITQGGVVFTVKQFGQYTNINVPQWGGTCLYNVRSTYPWTVVSDRTYCIPQMSGSTGNTEYGETLEVVWPESNSYAYRTATLTFTDSMGNVIRLSKNQDRLNINSIHYEYSGGTTSLDVSGSTIQKPSWIDVTGTTDGITISAGENEGGNREGTIIIQKGNGDIITIYVNQDGDEGSYVKFGVSPTDLFFDYSGQTQSVIVTNPKNNLWSAAGYPSWISMNTTQGSSTQSVNITAQANTGGTRTGTITFTNLATSSAYTVSITQYASGTTKSISATTINAASSGGTYVTTITYTNRGDDFVTITTEGGVVVGEIVFTGDTANVGITVPENTTLYPRTFVVNIYGNGVVGTLTIEQAGVAGYLNVVPTRVVFDGDGGTATITITSNDDWIIE